MIRRKEYKEGKHLRRWNSLEKGMDEIHLKNLSWNKK